MSTATATTLKPVTDAEINELATETEQTPAEVQKQLDAILAEDVLKSFPEDQRGPIAVGIFRSRAMSAMLDGGEPFHVYVLSSSAPNAVTPKEGEPFSIASVFGIGFSKHADGTDGPVGVCEVGIFIRKDSPAHMKDLHKQFVPGKTYEVSLARKGKDPEPGQRPFYSLSAVGSTKPKEIPTTPGLDAIAFIKKVFPPVAVADIPKKVSTDTDDINTWVSIEASVISARRGVSKGKKRPYGFFEVITPGTKISDLKANPNAKATVSVNPTQVQWTVGSKLIFVGPITPASDDGQYDAQMRARSVAPIIGIPYVQAVQQSSSASATVSAATDDAANLGDF